MALTIDHDVTQGCLNCPFEDIEAYSHDRTCAISGEDLPPHWEDKGWSGPQSPNMTTYRTKEAPTSCPLRLGPVTVRKKDIT